MSLGLKLLDILCTGTGHNKDRNYVLPYCVHNIKKILNTTKEGHWFIAVY